LLLGCRLLMYEATWCRHYDTATHPPRRAEQYRKMPCAATLCVCKSEWLPRRLQCWLLASRDSRRQRRLPSATSSLPKANAWQHLATCCLDTTSLPHIATSCLRVSAPTKSIQLIALPSETSWTVVTTLLLRMRLNHMTVNTRALCRIYQQHLKFQRVRRLK
jgi:hypothetical protein